MRVLTGSNARLRSDLERFLIDLGTDPFDIASRFRRDGMRGTLKSTSDCVVARYLSAVLTVDIRIMALDVTRDCIVVRRSRRRQLRVELPDAVKSFVAHFDDGCFPELLERESPAHPRLHPAANNSKDLEHDQGGEAPAVSNPPCSDVLPDTPTEGLSGHSQ